jgi:glycosyltransferase involved in cell wall biosynthesis
MKILMINRSTAFTVPGGDTVQMIETAKSIRKLGVIVDIRLADESINYSGYDLIHFFNIIRPSNISVHVKKAQIPFVISTIFVDYTEIDRKLGSLALRIASKLIGSDRLEYVKGIARWMLNNERIEDINYLLNGHKKSVEQLLSSASVLLPNSDCEFERLKVRYNFNNDYIKIPNAVSEEFYKNTPKVEKNGIVCIARIETLKNQFNLILAMQGLGSTLRIIGKPAPNHMDYYEKCKEIAPSNVEFLGQMDRADVINELDRAKVHVLPSWFETTGLSTLEAAARNCSIVITKKGDTKEYFGNRAWYCDPENVDSIRSALKAALNDDKQLQNYIKENYTWEMAADKTFEAYQLALSKSI